MQTDAQNQQTMQDGQQPLQQAIEYPMRQAVQFQRSAAQFFMNGLEMQDWAQQQGIQFTKTLLNSYLQTVERAGEGAARIPTEIAQQAQEGMQEGQAFAQQELQRGESMAQQAMPGTGMGDQQPRHQQMPVQQPPQQMPRRQQRPPATVPQQRPPQQQPPAQQQPPTQGTATREPEQQRLITEPTQE
ncbi:hypothetical protein ACKVMT_05690 [Halobacteriales archaeon Cl-PHB]